MRALNLYSIGIALMLLTNQLVGQATFTDIEWPYSWQMGTTGYNAGRNCQLITKDFNGDGAADPVFFSADGRFWYIMTYDEVLQDFEMLYVSTPIEVRIERLILFEDQSTTRVALLTNEDIYIYDISDLENVTLTRYSNYLAGDEPKRVRYADGDNDGEGELIIAGVETIVLLNPNTGVVEHTIVGPAYSFAVGNFVGDPDDLEIVYAHGAIIRLGPDGNIEPLADLLPGDDDSSFNVEGTDIDGDGLEEVLIQSTFLRMYNTTTAGLIWERYISNAGTLTVANLNDLGAEEIIYRCSSNLCARSSVSGILLWETSHPGISNPYGIYWDDYNGNGSKELMVASTDANGSRLVLFDEQEEEIIWRSNYEGPPYRAIKTLDIDEDGEEEIITLSQESETPDGQSGSKAGLISVYNKSTKELEFRSDPDLLPFTVRGNFTFEVADYGADNDLDIILAAGNNGNGSFWVVDGDTYEVEAEHIFSISEDGIFYVYATTLADVDQDGTVELLAASIRDLMAFDVETLALEWSVPLTGNADRPKKIAVGQLDSDQELEVVVLKDNIYLYDNGVVTQGPGNSSGYDAMCLADIHHDNQLEIIGGRSGNSDFLSILNRTTLERDSSIELATFGTTHCLTTADFNNDGKEELIAIQERRIHVVRLEEEYEYEHIRSNELDFGMGEYDAIEIDTHPENGLPIIYVGGQFRVLELNGLEGGCLFFDVGLASDKATCNEDNGRIYLTSAPEGTILELGEISFTDTLDFLAPGWYDLVATAPNGCVKDLRIRVEREHFITNLFSNDRSCRPEPDGSLSATVLGVPPYTYQWSTGDTISTILGLEVGNYEVVISDSLGCTDTLASSIQQRELQIDVEVLRASCSDQNTGRARVFFLEGTSPYAVNWNNNGSGPYIVDDLAPGLNTVFVQDGAECRDSLLFTVTESPLTGSIDLLQIDCNAQANGEASIMMTEGVEPFVYSWSNGSTTSQISSVSSGTYTVTVEDNIGCSIVDSVSIIAAELMVEGIVDSLLCHADTDGSIQLSVTAGLEPFVFEWTTGDTTANVSGLGPGYYTVSISDANLCTLDETYLVSAPPPLEVDVQIVNDSAETPEGEGEVSVEASGGLAPYHYQWSSGQEGNMITDLQAGDYFLTITDENDCTVELMVTVDFATAIEEIVRNAITIYPNPARSAITVENNSGIPINAIQVYHISGALISEFKGVDFIHQYTLPTASLPNGSYLLKVLFDQGAYDHRIQVIH